jgi:hypothetical protein
MRKKIFSIFLILILIVSLAGCNNSANSSKIDQPNTQLENPKSEEGQSLKDSTDENKTEIENEETRESQEESLEDIIDDDKSESTNKDDTQTSSESNDKSATSNNIISLSIEGPDDDIIYQNDQFELGDQIETAFDLLMFLQEQEEIRFEYMGSGNTTYLKGIGDYYEFDFGPLSGWMIEKNGEFPLKSIGNLEVQSGDNIRFRYTKELGDDLTN